MSAKTIDSEFKKLGSAFRGLWKSVTVSRIAEIDKEEGYACTFILNGEVVETDYCVNPIDALSAALEILKKYK